MGRFRADRLWFAGGTAGTVLLAVIAWFMLISPQFSNATSLKDQTQTAQTLNDALRRKIGKLQAETANKDALVAELRSAQEALPGDSGVPALTRQLAAQAAAAHVTLKSISVGTPVLATTQINPTAPATPSSGSAGPSSSGSDAAGKLYSIPITLVSEGTAANQRGFLLAIQHTGPRDALISSTQISPGSGATTGSISATSSMTTQLLVFAAPLSPAAAAELATQLGNVGN